MIVFSKNPEFLLRPGKKCTCFFSKTILPICLFLAVYFCSQFLCAPCGTAMESFVDGSIGYDSNPSLADKAESSWFSAYHAGMAKQFLLTDALILDTVLDAAYQDYRQVKDNYHGQARAIVSYPLANGLILPSILGGVAAYRDHFVEAEERNEALVGLDVSVVLSKRLTLGLEHSWKWQDYLNWAKPFSGRGQGRNPRGGRISDPKKVSGPGVATAWMGSPPDEGQNGHGGGNMLNKYQPPRNDVLVHTALGLEIFLMPSLTGSLFAAYADLDSSLDMESYRQIQVGIALFWEPFEKWRMETRAELYRTKYDKVPESMTHIKTTNQTRSIGIQISRFWGHMELYGQVRLQDCESPLDFESYTQQVVQCGLSWSFSY